MFLSMVMVISLIPVSQVGARAIYQTFNINPGATSRYAGRTPAGWEYEAWTDTRAVNGVPVTNQSSRMTLYSDGGFSCEWNNTYNTLFRTGRRWDVASARPRVDAIPRASIRYDVRNFSSANGATYLCIYGWTDGTTGNNTTGGAIIEWYVVDRWMHWNPERAGRFPADPNSTYRHHGTMTANGNTYDIISAWRINQPWVGPGANGTFLQLFNVRRNSQITGGHPQTNTLTGTIDMAAHFQSWINLGVINNPQGNQSAAFAANSRLYEISFTLEGYGGMAGGSSGRGEVRELCLAYTGQITRLCTNNGCVNCTTGGGTTTAPTHSISLSQTGMLTFPSAPVGFDLQPTQTITVTNTGNQPTGPLTIAAPPWLTVGGRSGLETGLGTTTATNNTRNFTLNPSRGINQNPGTHTGTVTVTGGNGISTSFPVSFTVTPPPCTCTTNRPPPIYEFTPSEVVATALNARENIEGLQPSGEPSFVFADGNLNVSNREGGWYGVDVLLERLDLRPNARYRINVTGRGMAVGENLQLTFPLDADPWDTEVTNGVADNVSMEFSSTPVTGQVNHRIRIRTNGTGNFSVSSITIELICCGVCHVACDCVTTVIRCPTCDNEVCICPTTCPDCSQEACVCPTTCPDCSQETCVCQTPPPTTTISVQVQRCDVCDVYKLWIVTRLYRIEGTPLVEAIERRVAKRSTLGTLLEDCNVLTFTWQASSTRYYAS